MTKLKIIDQQINKKIQLIESSEVTSQGIKSRLEGLVSVNETLKKNLIELKEDNFNKLERMNIVFNALKKKYQEEKTKFIESKELMLVKSEELQALKGNHYILAQEISKFRERGLMGIEEMVSMKQREADLIKIVQVLRNQLIIKKIERNELMTKQNLDLLKNAEESFFADISKQLRDDYYYVKYSLQSDYKLQDGIYHYDSLYAQFSHEYFTNALLVARDKFRKDGGLFRSNLSASLNEDIDLGHLRLLKPSLFQVYKHRVEILTTKESTSLISTKFDLLSLIRTIRAILDCKWNELVLYNNRCMYSRFSDFVYYWVSNYELDIPKGRISHSDNSSISPY